MQSMAIFLFRLGAHAGQGRGDAGTKGPGGYLLLIKRVPGFRKAVSVGLDMVRAVPGAAGAELGNGNQ